MDSATFTASVAVMLHYNWKYVGILACGEFGIGFLGVFANIASENGISIITKQIITEDDTSDQAFAQA